VRDFRRIYNDSLDTLGRSQTSVSLNPARNVKPRAAARYLSVLITWAAFTRYGAALRSRLGGSPACCDQEDSSCFLNADSRLMFECVVGRNGRSLFFSWAFAGCQVTCDIPALIKDGGLAGERMQTGYLAVFPKSGSYYFWGVARC